MPLPYCVSHQPPKLTKGKSMCPECGESQKDVLAHCDHCDKVLCNDCWLSHNVKGYASTRSDDMQECHEDFES